MASCRKLGNVRARRAGGLFPPGVWVVWLDVGDGGDAGGDGVGEV
ncbi:hypothetical protein SAMN04487917_1191, partial [Arthrobacter sp. yr096]